MRGNSTCQRSVDVAISQHFEDKKNICISMTTGQTPSADEDRVTKSSTTANKGTFKTPVTVVMIVTIMMRTTTMHIYQYDPVSTYTSPAHTVGAVTG